MKGRRRSVIGVLAIAALLVVGLTSSASAGGGDKRTASAAKKCSPKSKGSDKFSPKKKKCKKKKAPAPVVTPPAAVASLSISPMSVDFGPVEHGGFGACGADPDPKCPTQAFTVTNSGSAASGVPTASITELQNPEVAGPAAFAVTANTCTAALPPGATCTLTVKFAPNSNAGDQMFSSRLDVAASPGSSASSALSGMAT